MPATKSGAATDPKFPPVGKPAPAFSLRDDQGRAVTLDQFRGKPVVLYWYPADDTPGCTRQACDLRDAMPKLGKLKAVVLGASPDSVESHVRFRKKYDLPFALLSDPDHTVAKAYGVWGPKKTFGVSYNGINRTTFIIDASGVLRKVIPVKRVAGHDEAVAAALAELT